jgi:uncharacterized membrane protein YhaH (DUF805 family)
MKWAFLPFWRYAEFSGRSRRKEYWMFFLLNMVVLFALGAYLFLTLTPETVQWKPTESRPGVVFILWLLATFVPSLALQARRLHDQDRSGWFILLGFIPYIGGLIMFVFALLEGTPGPNTYGPDPRGDESWSVRPAGNGA